MSKIYIVSIILLVLFMGLLINNEQKQKEIERLTKIIEMREKQLDLMVILAKGEYNE